MPRRFQGMRHPHESDLLPVPKHRANREPCAEDVAVLSTEGDLFLELPVLDRLLQETRNEGRHVLRQMEGRDAQLPDDLGGRATLRLVCSRCLIVYEPLHITPDDARLSLQCRRSPTPLHSRRWA